MTRPSNVGHISIPADPDQSRFRFIHVAAARARQIQRGARPIIPVFSKKPTVIAMNEVRLGLVQYTNESTTNRLKADSL